MASFNRSFTSSPVLGLQSQGIHHMGHERPTFAHQSHSYNQGYSWPSQPILHSTSTLAGRKRSRDEAAPNLDEPEKLVPIPTVEEFEDEWEYGPGMTIIRKKKGYVADATSQSGTWLEEKTAAENAKKLEVAIAAQEQLAQERPSLRSNKSQRLDMRDTVLPVTTGNEHSSPARERSPEAPTQPVVDAFTIHLGVGWNRISEDAHIQAAARGWARFIENHYSLTNANIRLESKGLESYLVEANEGYFLFAENLKQGRLVSTNAEQALLNLRSSPPVFAGSEVLLPNEAATALDLQPTAAANEATLAPAHSTPMATARDVEMDLS